MLPRFSQETSSSRGLQLLHETLYLVRLLLELRRHLGKSTQDEAAALEGYQRDHLRRIEIFLVRNKSGIHFLNGKIGGQRFELTQTGRPSSDVTDGHLRAASFCRSNECSGISLDRNFSPRTSTPCCLSLMRTSSSFRPTIEAKQPVGTKTFPSRLTVMRFPEHKVVVNLVELRRSDRLPCRANGRW